MKRKRLNLLLEFNKYAAELMSFIDYSTKLSLEASARLNAYFMKSKEFIMFSVKYKYQTGYVYFKRGQLDPAIAAMGQSVEFAKRAGDQVGEGISTCVHARFRWLAAQATSAEFRDALT